MEISTTTIAITPDKEKAVQPRRFLDNLLYHIRSYYRQEGDIAPLAIFRVIFGFCVVVSTLRFMLLGWIHKQYIEPTYHFHYYGFSWVKGIEYLGETGVYLLFILLLLSALCVMLGAFYRLTSILMFLSFTYIELLDVSYYLNHYYFVSIVALLLTLLPAHRAFSVDVWRKPSLQLERIPIWLIDILKVQLAIVYIYAGVAKIRVDWLLHAQPLVLWLPAHDQLPFIGHFFRERWVAYIFSWTGMVYDCTIPFFLLWRRTRIVAYLAVIIFHSLTGWMFQIGVFPLVMTLCTLIFFDAASHRRVIDKIQHWLRKAFASTKEQTHERDYPSNTLPIALTSRSLNILAVLFSLHIMIQLLFPWRYVLYKGNMFWTEQGYRFGWRVMLMEKAGTATFYVRDTTTGREGLVDNREFLNEHQEKQMAMQPDLILQYAQHLAKVYGQRGIANPYIRGEVWVTLNARPSRLLLDSSINLSSLQDSWEDKWWITPQEE